MFAVLDLNAESRSGTAELHPVFLHHAADIDRIAPCLSVVVAVCQPQIACLQDLKRSGIISCILTAEINISYVFAIVIQITFVVVCILCRTFIHCIICLIAVRVIYFCPAESILCSICISELQIHIAVLSLCKSVPCL